MDRLKIIIVAANCYPALGPRAHRATELAKEFARIGHDVTLYALLGDYDYTDYSRQTGIKFKNLGISKLGLSDNTGYRKSGVFLKIINKVFRRALEFPFIELFFLVTSALKKVQQCDLLLTIAHPHPIHWAIPFLPREFYKTWIADCGDPFVGDPFNPHPQYFKYFEKKWCDKVDFITVPIEDARKAYYAKYDSKIEVIPQGFNIENVDLAVYEKNSIPTFAYSGVVYPEKRDPTAFLMFLAGLKIDFRFIVYTKNINFFLQFKKYLGSKLVLLDYIPRNKLIYELSKMDYLINVRNQSNVQQPSKLIDYALTGRPVLDISSNFNEVSDFMCFFNGDYSNFTTSIDVNKYDIKNIAQSYLMLVDRKS